MRGSRANFLTSLVMIAVAVIMLSSTAWTADSTAWPVWPAFHADMVHNGRNPKSTDLKNPASLGLVWVFPRSDSLTVVEEDSTVDDNVLPKTPPMKNFFFDGLGKWSKGISESAYEVDDTKARRFHYMTIVPLDYKDSEAAKKLSWRVDTAKWVFPYGDVNYRPSVSLGFYKVWIWVPEQPAAPNVGDPTYTTKAKYIVHDDNGATEVTFDQTSGGTWQLLADKQFSFRDATKQSQWYVELPNVTGDTFSEITDDEGKIDKNISVIADAVKFEQGTGMEIYSSPVSATIDYTWIHDPTKASDYIDAQNDYSGKAPVVYVGTVETPLVNSTSAPDSGAVYCIDSVTPTTSSFTYDANAKKWHSPYEELSQNIGKDIWRYPNIDPNKRDPLEGPIEGGVFSTPTLAHVLMADGTQKLVCYVTGMDRQIYALDAETGVLLWKGPGMTVSERRETGWGDPGLPPNELKKGDPIRGRADAFGGDIQYTSGSAPMRWSFTDLNLSRDSGRNGAGWSYAVYAWIPPPGDGEPDLRTLGKYTISYTNSSGGLSSSTVTVDQSSAENQGKWVKLGSSYFNVSEVNLGKVEKATGTPSGSIVVADAVMIVPDTIGAFSYCSPVANLAANLEEYPDTEGTFTSTVGDNMFADAVYAVTATGRALSFKAMGGGGTAGARLCYTNWVYPAIRNKQQVTGDADADKPAMGAIGASPTFHKGSTGGRLFIAALDGKIRCVDAVNGTEIWTYQDVPASSTTTGPPFGGTTSLGGYTSTPAIDKQNEQLFIGSTGGYFYCLDAAASQDATSAAILKWRYPSADGVVPLGAFRYSTAVVGKASDGQGSSELERVWIGSTDGHIYTFNIDPNFSGTVEDRRLWVENKTSTSRIVHGIDYVEPTLLSPIQGSIACDAASSATTKSGGGFINNTMTMYVGDMNGLLHWNSANSGRSDWTWAPSGSTVTPANYTSYQTQGELFSSPNVTNFSITGVTNDINYVYVGCADGRVYAFSNENGAWGGRWAGGHWPFPGDPYDITNGKIEKLTPNTAVQFDIFPPDFFKRSNDYYPDPKSGTGDFLLPTDSTTDWVAKGGEWIVSEGMKVPTGVTSATDLAGDTAINDALRTAALERRNYVDNLSSRTVTGNNPIYFEWGETINMILWDLPPLNSLSGSSSSSKRGGIRINMMNTSAGESGGSQAKMAGRITQLKEYTVLDSSGDALTYADGTEVKRCYALATIDITSSGRPLSPGPGWTITAEIRTKTSTSSTATYTTKIIPLARLEPGSPPSPFVADGDYQPQLLGINNPLAIRDDAGAAAQSLAWPDLSGFQTDRTDPEAHYNGNGVGDNTSFTTGILPVTDLGLVNHGSSSRRAELYVMDRSATGIKIERGSPKALDNFRVSAGELRWNGDNAAIASSGGIMFPWEFGAGSVDYPNIYKQRQSYRKATDDGDPANASTSLPPLLGPPSILDYDNCSLRPETVFVSVDVPRFQPANCGSTGYSRDMEAFIDSNRNQQWDSGNVVIGRPSTYQEAYRRFVTGIRVPPDPKIEVEEQLIDVGRAPHGLGEGLTGDYEFSPYNPTPEIRQWFKPVTIKNAGNVNLPDMYIGRSIPMYSDQAGAISPMPEGAITSSLDWVAPTAFAPMKGAPFTSGGLGYTLTKAKVGDPDPSVMTIPDKRKWDMNYGSAKDAATTALTNLNTLFKTDLRVDQPLPVKVGVRVPLTQPIGSYYSFDRRYRLPYVPVFSDRNGNGQLDAGMEPVAESSFQLKAAVRENQLTGGVTPMTLPQIDIPDTRDLNSNGLIDDGEDFTPRVGDATPAAFRDPTTGYVHLFWSSNRMFGSSLYPDWSNANDPKRTEFANAPWFIDRATLSWDEHGSVRSGWQTSGGKPDRWWKIPTDATDATLPGSDNEWPVTTNLMKWTFNGSPTSHYSVRHHSPVIAQTLLPNKTAGIDPTWLAWVGTADMQDPASEKVTQDHMIFYTNATGGEVTDPSNPIFYINHDPGMVKRSPSLSIFGSRMWMFWQGGNKGNWSIMYSTNDTPGFLSSGWAQDSSLRTPDCLTSVSSPNCIFRRFWGSLAGDTPDYTNGTVGRQLLDIVYAGTSKYGQSPDILLGRYFAANTGAATPGKVAQPMPRIFNEQLRRDPKFGYYVSQHLAWIRPDTANPVFDNWGLANPAIYLDVPYIHVVFPVGYDLPGLGAVGTMAVVSATDGSVLVDGKEKVAPQKLVPILDDATGIFTYKYPDAITRSILGDMLVDFSAGVVRFTQPLNEVKVGDHFIAPQVRAEYTPQTWRLTTDAAVDNSPRAFIERTDMNKTAYPGMCDWSSGTGGTKPAPIDRLWVFWRKAGTGVNTSTIYYKTYRVGIDLTKLGYQPIPMITDSSTPPHLPGQVAPKANITVSNALGPWEVNRAGTKIYFSEVDERYRSLLTSGSSAALGTGPASPVTVDYTPEDASSPVTVKGYDISWIEEMPEQSLFGFSADGNVNEGSIYAFYDPKPEFYSISAFGSGTWEPILSSKIWVFWTSTRGGTSDLFWETLSPNFTAD
ncbi:MAG: hypothetical protein ACYC64_17580 [Armatimonadota bacterium]